MSFQPPKTKYPPPSWPIENQPDPPAPFIEVTFGYEAALTQLARTMDELARDIDELIQQHAEHRADGHAP